MKNIYLLSFILILIASTLRAQQQGGGFYDQLGQEGDHAQSIQQLEKAAQKAHNKGDHYSAMQLYTRIIAVDSAYAPAWRGFAESAFDQGAYEKSAEAWTYVAQLNPQAPDWSAWLKVADIRMRLGDYRQAERIYVKLHLQEDNLSPQQKKDLAEADRRYERALEATSGTTPISLVILNKPLNTEYAEISPFPLDHDLYYASFDFDLKKDSHKPKRKQMRAMVATPDGNDFGVAQANFNEEQRHTANATFSPDGQRMFYSLCDYVDTSSTATTCELYMRTRNADGGWGEAVKLPEHINLPGYTATQPNLGQMPGLSGEVLFFVSNRPGSKRRDIWYSRVLSEGFGSPVNFAAVNTASNEATPFYHAGSGKFYFASDDNEQSLGGYDIFTVKPGGEGWEEKVNLGSPINSGGDDLYMSLTPKGNTAFFSTNRLAVGKALETANEDGCCFDIVRVDLIPPPVIAIPFEKFTNFKDTLSETRFTLWRKDKDNWVKDTAVDIAGKMWKFSVPPGVEYKLICDKQGYSSDTVPVLIPLNTWDDQPRIVRLELTPQRVNLVVHVIDGETGLPLNGTVAELAEWSSPNATPFLRDSAHYASTDTHRYPLDFERQYQATVSKQGYVTETGKVVSTIGLNSTKTLRDTIKLYRGVEFIASAFDLSRIDPKTDKNLPLKGVTFRLVDDSLNKLAGSFTNRKGNTWQQTIYRDHRYTIYASKPNFTSDSLPFNPSQLIDKTKAMDTVRQDLFLYPTDLASYLPLKLYFDNDYPDPKTQRDTTEKLYVSTYIPYYQRKDVFLEENRKAGGGVLLLEKVDDFFDSDVKGEWNRMRYFTEVLFSKLKKGSRIEITIKGFASPRAGSEYNRLLTARRIATILNHFANFDEQALLERARATQQLVITEEANGEDLAPKDIEAVKPLGSIFSVEASRERRIEIIGVEITGGGPSGK